MLRTTNWPAMAVMAATMVLAACGGGSSVHDNASGRLDVMAGSPGLAGATDGNRLGARFNSPGDVVADKFGNIYVADTKNQVIRKITPEGIVSTLAGTLGVVGHVDGASTAAVFYNPKAIAVDAAGNVFVADDGEGAQLPFHGIGIQVLPPTLGYTGSIRKITPTGLVTTLAFTEKLPLTTDTQPPVTGYVDFAIFNGAGGVAVDQSGNVYAADTGNNVVRKIAPDGTISIFAGGAAGSADGVGTGARFQLPGRLAVDREGSVYVSDTANYTVRKITPAGVVTTIAGMPGVSGYADGAAATLSWPVGLAVTSDGTVFVADPGFCTVRKIAPTGIVSTVVGTVGSTVAMPGPLPASLYQPTGVAIDSQGQLLITSGHAVYRTTGF